MNSQQTEHQSLTLAGELNIREIFYSIQGEGPFAGEPAVFVRLAGCNLQCPMCDTDYTRTRASMYPHQIFEAVNTCYKVGMINGFTPQLVVITGGEPFRQNIGPFVHLLVKSGFKVQIETNGTLFVPGLPWQEISIVCSPKTPKLNERIQSYITSYKYVLENIDVDEADGLPFWVMGNASGLRIARPPSGFRGQVFVQPLDTKDKEKNKENLAACVRSCMRFGYRLCIQLHKIAGLE